MRVQVLIGAALVALSLLQPARADDGPALAMCKVITDNVAELIRNGEMSRAKRSQPELEKCLALQRAALNREAQRIIDSHDAAARKIAH